MYQLEFSSERNSGKKYSLKFGGLSKKIIFAAENLKLKKTITMKKVLAIVAIAAFAACNNGETKPATDSPAVKKDSPVVKVDSPAVKVDSPAVKVDSPAVKH